MNSKTIVPVENNGDASHHGESADDTASKSRTRVSFSLAGPSKSLPGRDSVKSANQRRESFMTGSASFGQKQTSGWISKKLKENRSQEFKDDGANAEPEGPSRLRLFVRSSSFTVATTLLICVNAVIIGVETDYGDDSEPWMIIEYSFLGAYTIELLLRVAGEGLGIFKVDAWIRFDAFVMFIAFFDMLVLSPILLKGGGGEAKQVAMVLRIMRLSKLTRLLRLLRFFKELWLLVSSFGSAFKTLAWTFILLIMVLYIFGILFVKLLGDVNDDEDIQAWFGSLALAMFTLFQIMTLENWAEIARTVWASDQWFMTILILVFIGISSFAIMNTVMAVIVEHTLGEAMSQKDDLLEKAEQEMTVVANQLLDLFSSADSDKTQTLSRDEFTEALAAPATRRLLAKMDLGEDFAFLEKEDVGMLFDTMDVDHSRELTPQEFVTGMMQMRGTARARRVFELHCGLQKFRNQALQVLTGLRRDMGKLLAQDGHRSSVGDSRKSITCSGEESAAWRDLMAGDISPSPAGSNVQRSSDEEKANENPEAPEKPTISTDSKDKSAPELGIEHHRAVLEVEARLSARLDAESEQWKKAFAGLENNIEKRMDSFADKLQHIADSLGAAKHLD